MSVEVVTFGCRLNAAESEVIRREAERAGLERHGGRQYLRGDRGGRAPGAPGHPQAAPRAARAQASSSPAARRRPSRRPSPPWPRSTACSAMRKSSTPRHGRKRARLRRRRRAEGDRQRHHGGQGDRGASDRRLRRPHAAPSCRCRTAATTAAPSASFRSAAAIRARCRWARWSAQVRRLVAQRLSRDRADRRRHHQLRRRPAGRADARHAGASRSSSTCRS